MPRTVLLTQLVLLVCAHVACVHAQTTEPGSDATASNSTPPLVIEYPDQKIAVMVEFRILGLIVPVLHNFVSHLTPEWNFLIIHGPSLRRYLRTSPYIWDLIRAKRLELREVPVEAHSKEEYSEFMKSYALYESIHAEHILVFQTDSALCKHSDLSEWAEYDYVGAPWRGYGCTGFGPIDVGNGGLSYRRRSAMLKIISAPPVEGMPSTYAEDLYFACMALHLKLRVPTAQKAMRFAMEMLSSDEPLGFHQIQVMGRRAADVARAANCSAYRHIFKDGLLPIGISSSARRRLRSSAGAGTGGQLPRRI